MSTENPMLNSVKEAFAPVTEAFKNFQNMEVPEAAREFVKKQAETAKERAADFYAGSEKATDAIESAVAGSVSEVAKISRRSSPTSCARAVKRSCRGPRPRPSI
jgi:hypothetical protein